MQKLATKYLCTVFEKGIGINSIIAENWYISAQQLKKIWVK